MKRKLLLFSISFLSVSCTVFAQSNQGKLSKNIRPTTYRDRLKAESRIAEYAFDSRTGTTAFVRFNEYAGFDKSKSEELLSAYLPVRKNLDALTKLREEEAYSKMNVQRYQQYFRGIKVEHGTYVVTSVNNKIAFMSGEYYSIDPDQSTVAVINEATALQKAMQYVHAAKYIWQTADSVSQIGSKPAAELVFVDNAANPGGQRLAYKFDIYAVSPVSRAYIYIDAADGTVILEDKIIKHLTPGQATQTATQTVAVNNAISESEGFSPLANSTASADTKYTGTRSITTDQVSAGLYRLRETGRTSGANNLGSTVETYNCKTAATYTTAVDFTDADNNWTSAEYNNAAKDNAALDAHWGAEKVIDYWWNVHNRRSIDNKGYGIRSYVHYDVAFDNAYWNGTAMTYGDGSGSAGGGFEILTAVDVCGHEIGHGLCEFTANLVYSNESGAMNEGFSDIWGACVENYAITIGDVPVGDNKEPFKIGEEIVASAAQPLRSMSNPNSTTTYGRQPDTYTGTYWYTGALDNGGVHTNSGVLNHWFYILVQGEAGTNDLGNAYNVTGLGWSKAEKIAYITELNLAANANYAACRTAAINAAIALYGRCSAEHIAVTNAWYAVGVGAVFGSCTTSSTVQFAINTDKVYENSGAGSKF